jgi:hypothetical protein
VLGFYWRGVIMEAISQEAWDYFAVCIPVVVFGAPIGSVLGTHFHRLVLAAMVIVLDTIALISAFAIIRPLPAALIGGCVGIIVGCFIMFMLLTFAGSKILDQYEKSHTEPFYQTEYTLDYDCQGDVIEVKQKQVAITVQDYDNVAFEIGEKSMRRKSF